MCDAAIWSDALTAAQIYKIYTNGLLNGVDAVTTIQGTGSTWSKTSGGNWSTGANWNNGVAPNSTTVSATFGTSITASSTVTNDNNFSVSSITFASPTYSYTLAGSSNLTLGGSSPSITVNSGSHTVKTPLTTSAALTLNSVGTLNMGSQAYTVGTIIGGSGVVVVTNLDIGGNPSGIGASSPANANLVLNGGTLKYTGPGATTDRGIMMYGGTSTLDASGTGPVAWIPGGIGQFVDKHYLYPGATTLVLTGTNTSANTFGLYVADGYGTRTVIKNGPGTWVFGSPFGIANTYLGNTLIQQGTLALSDLGAVAASANVVVSAGATLDVSALTGFSLSANQTLQGFGTVTGSVSTVTGSAIAPGTKTTAGTLVFTNDLNLVDGTTIDVDMAATTSGTSDLIVVGGNLNLSGTTALAIKLLSPPNVQAGGSYVILRYTGSLTGDASNFMVTNNTTVHDITVSVDTSAKTVSLVVASGAAPTYTWVGDGSANIWQSGVTNWSSGGSVAWIDGANALFNDTGSQTPAVTISNAVAPESVTVNANNNYTIGGAAISGVGALTNSGNGTLLLNGTNSYSGGTFVTGGTLQLGNNYALSSAATSSSTPDTNVFLTIAGGTLDLNGHSLDTQYPATSFLSPVGQIVLSGTGAGGNGAIVNSGANSGQGLRNLSLAGDATINAASGSIGVANSPIGNMDGRIFLNGHTLTKIGAGEFSLQGGVLTNGNLVIAQGTFDSWGNGLNSWPTFAANSTVTISNGAAWHIGLNGATSLPCLGTINLSGSLVGWFTGALTFSGPVNLQSGYSIAPNNATSMTFQGPVNGNQNFNKNSSGLIILAATNTYTGNTLITAGTLKIATNGSIATSPVIGVDALLDVTTVTGGFKVVSGQTLEGTNGIAGSVTIQSGATLAPGDAGIGTLTFSNSLTLAGNTVMEVNSTGPVSDLVANTSGTLQYGGTLTVANLGSPLVAGNTFTLFSSTNGTSNFAAFSPTHPNSDSTLLWSFNPTNGVLSVVSSGPPPSPTLTFTNQAGANLVFSWTGSGFKLQSQTNSLNVGLTTNWFDYPGGSTSPVSVPVSQTAGSVFFRLSQ